MLTRLSLVKSGELLEPFQGPAGGSALRELELRETDIYWPWLRGMAAGLTCLTRLVLDCCAFGGAESHTVPTLRSLR